MPRTVILALAFLTAALAGCVTVDEGASSRPAAQGPASGAEDGAVSAVISGDTIRLDSGEIVRYAGIRAPSEGEDFFSEARLANERLVFGKDVRVRVVFVEGAKDDDGRRFAHVYTPGVALKLMTWVNAELMEGGWGRLDYRALSEKFEARFEEREAAARAGGRGIWKMRG